jgi:hypothetical protein
MWFILQGSIVFAVVASNIHWQWTPNAYLATILGAVAALLVTVAVNGLLALKAQQAARKKKVR